jgi:hypothetical protein
MADLLLTILKAIWNALSHGARVFSSEPKESHSATEYVDALLFPDEKDESGE